MEKKSKVDQLKEMMNAKKEAEEKKSQVASRSSLVSETPTTTPEGPKTLVQEQQIGTEEMAAQIKAAEDEAKAHYDKLLRVMAEFENFKKRIDRERMEQAKYANQFLIHDLLPVLDDLDRVLDHIPSEATSEIAAIADGVKLIQNHFITALSKHGLSPLESAIGKPFDPNFHEAVAHIESNEYPEGAVTEEHRRGWKLHDRIVRAATVSVAKAVKHEA